MSGSRTAKIPRRIGIKSTPELRSVLQQVLALSPPEEDSDALPPIGTTEDDDIPERGVVAAALKPLSVPIARETMQRYFDDEEGDEGNDDDDISPSSPFSKSIPLDVIHAAKSLLHHHPSPRASSTSPTLLVRLESTVASSAPLLFPSSTPAPRDPSYRRRLERLRLSEQERNYAKITSNLDSSTPDDATVKSMLYATSVGLNMIVAPISFGVFMYFFSGALFSYWDGDGDVVDGERRGGVGEKLDVRKVIVAVVSGVVMLFIEMILFVIRNHEMDKYVTKKMKKGKKNPFGYNKMHAKRTFNG